MFRLTVVRPSTLSLAFAAACLAHATMPATARCQSGSGYSTLNEIDSMMNAFLRAEDIPGATVALSLGGRLVWNKAYGHADADRNVTMHTYHRTKIGSVSKIITALGVMRLTEMYYDFNVDKLLYGNNGVLGNTYDWAIMFPGGAQPEWALPIRVKHLLSHTTGFDGGGDAREAAERFNIPLADITYDYVHLNFLLTKPLLFPAGTDEEYSNHGMGVNTLVIEKVSHQSYRRFIRQRILDPLQLDDVVPYSDPLGWRDSATHAYVNGVPRVVDAPPKSATGLAAGGWAATARDLVRLMCATDRINNHSDLLWPSTLDLMETPPFPGVTSNCLGWHRTNGGKLHHSGSIKGGAAFIAKFPPGYHSNEVGDMSDINVAICINIQKSGPLERQAQELAKVVARNFVPGNYDLF